MGEPRQEKHWATSLAPSAHSQAERKAIAADLYKHCVYPSPTGNVSEKEFQLIAAGRSADKQLKETYPHLLQLTLDDMLRFIYQRFASYRSQKRDHQQWDFFGKMLWSESERYSLEDFVKKMLGLT
ncbi:MAG: hypothetical protein WAL56_02455 [Candidatus Sulfotelmatobacter sp.]